MTRLVANAGALRRHGLRRPRTIALDLLETGLAAADPFAATLAQLRVERGALAAGGRRFPLGGFGRVLVLGAGKASLRVAQALEALLGDRISGGLVVVRRGSAEPLKRVEVVEAEHPVPGTASLRAGRRLVELATGAEAGDLVLAVVTGGSSALASLPPDGVPFAAKRRLHRLLLGSGAPIEEVNAVRKHVSAIKGGRLAAAAAPATVLNVSVSDVVGDRLDCLTDNTVQDESTVADAVGVLEAFGLWDRVDPTIRRHLRSPAAESPDLSAVDITSVLVVTGDRVCDAMRDRAAEVGIPPVVLGSSIGGDAAAVGGVLASLAGRSVGHGGPFPARCALLAAGGELTVRLSGRSGFGLGGPNQEGVLGLVLGLAPDAPLAAALVDSDGSDGGTGAAGGMADGLSRRRADRLGLDLRSLLVRHRSTEALAALGDQVLTGPTGTNCNDIWVVVLDG